MSLKWIKDRTTFFHSSTPCADYLGYHDPNHDLFIFRNIKNHSLILDRAAIRKALQANPDRSTYEINDAILSSIVKKEFDSSFSPFASAILGMSLSAFLIFILIVTVPGLYWIAPLLIPTCLGAGLCFLTYPYFFQNPNAINAFRYTLLLGTFILATSLGAIAGSLIPAIGMVLGILISVDTGILTAVSVIVHDYFKKESRVDYQKEIAIMPGK